MQFSLLFGLPPVVQAHLTFALTSLLLGAVMLLRRKGDVRHKIIGRLWVALMAATALTSFFIHSMPMIGPFGPIHILSVIVLSGLVSAVRAVRRGDVAVHRKIMVRLYVVGLIIPGLFTLVPGRDLGEIVFGPLDARAQTILWLVIGLAASIVAVLYLRSAAKLPAIPLQGGRADAVPGPHG